MFPKAKISRTCKKCGKLFVANASEVRRGGANFCSAACWYSYAKENKTLSRPGIKIEKICSVCGKTYHILPCHDKRGNAQYCSLKCKHSKISGRDNPNFRDAVIEVKCRMCGKKFITGRHRLKAGRGVTCSVSCRVEYYLKFQKKNKDTSIEIAMEQELIRRGIPYMKQVPIKEYFTIVDFLLPNKIIVYCDGDYWHNLPNAKIKDARQNIELPKFGYTVHRFWEHEIKKSVSDCVDRIINS